MPCPNNGRRTSHVIIANPLTEADGKTGHLYDYDNPASGRNRMISENFLTPNFFMMLARCISTVLTLIRSSSATSRRSEEHTSELQSLMRISYAVFCLK